MVSGNAIITHAFASGTVIFDRMGEMSALVELGKQLWSASPRPLCDAQVQSWRYRVSGLIRDLEDVSPDCPEAVMLAGLLDPRLWMRIAHFMPSGRRNPKG